MSCSNTFSTCQMASGCAQPSCTGGGGGGGGTPDARPGGGGGGSACTKLAACCGRLPTNTQPACTQVASGGNENICQSTLDGLGAICN